MGVTVEPIKQWLRRPDVLLGLALASIIGNVVIVVTGGAVRLTGSGLGCPTWPSCTDQSLTPTKAYALHGIIEFTNRQLTFVLGVIAALTLIAALMQRRERGLAGWALGIIPAQAVVGGISVKTDLNPWVVSLHFLISIGIIAVTVVLHHRLAADRREHESSTNSVARWLSLGLVAVTATVLVAGTVVTGAGPHPGTKNASGKVHRNGLNVASMSQLHADLVMILIGLTVGLIAVLIAVRAAARLRKAAWLVLAAELAQGAIGYAQYFSGVPAPLVGLHMLGACVLWIAVLHLALVAVGSGARKIEPTSVVAS